MFGGHNGAAQPADDTSVSTADVSADAVADSTTVSPTPAAPPALDSPAFLPAPTDPEADSEAPAAPTAGAPVVAGTATTDDDLLGIKQQALQQLSPLVGHLDQSPEDKFRTTMMMIQASDNQTLIKEAYEAAQQISDEKVRAQALLDIINEINYFTQQGQNSTAASSDAS